MNAQTSKMEEVGPGQMSVENGILDDRGRRGPNNGKRLASTAGSRNSNKGNAYKSSCHYIVFFFFFSQVNICT